MFVHDDILDDGLDAGFKARCSAVYACSAYPTTYTEATSTFAIGRKLSPSISGPSNRTGGGREVVVAAFSDGTVLAEGAARWLAFVDDTADVRLVVAPVTPEVEITTAFALTTALRIGFPNYEDAE